MLAKKMMLGLGSGALALMLSACGSVPSCDDGDAQDELKAKYLQYVLESRGLSEEGGNEFDSQAVKLIKEEMKFTIENFITDKEDEKRKRAVCKAEIRADIDEEKLRDVIVLSIKSKFSRRLPKNEVLTDSVFEEMVSKQFGSSSKYEDAIDKELEKMLERLDAKAHRLEYTLRETDDGKLVVNLENYN